MTGSSGHRSACWRYLAVGGVLLVVLGCQETGAPSSPPGGVRLMLQLQNALSGETLDIAPHYRRADDGVVPLEVQQVPLQTGATQTIPVEIDVTSCLADEAREPIGTGCPLRLTLTLRNAQSEVLDSQEMGPLDATPGASLTPPQVTLRRVETIVLTAASTTLLIGQPATVSAEVRDRTSTTVSGRPLSWATSNAAVATVSQAGVVTPLTPGPVTITATLQERPTGPAGTILLTVESSGNAVIGSSGGTVYSRAGEVVLTIPAGALTAPTTISIQPADTVVLSRLVTGTLFGFHPDGLTFQLPATLTVRYNPANIPAGVVNEPALRLFALLGATTVYQEVPGSTVNTSAHTVTGSITHFSTYGVQIAMVGVQAIAVGENHSCAVISTGQALCWGQGSGGGLGDGLGITATQPVVVLGGHSFSAVTAGLNYTCGLASGLVYCWGSNTLGQLGIGTTTNALQPQLVTLPGPVQSIDAGYDSACAIDQTQAVLCWGGNSNGQLGVATTTLCGNVPCSPVPLGLGPTVPVATMSSGLQHRCGVSVTFAGCWGWNAGSALGLPGSTASSQSPVPPPSGAPGPFTRLSAGSLQTCGLLANGSAYCWGGDFFGSRGTGVTTGVLALPMQAVVGGLQFSMLDAGGGNSVFTSACGVTLAGDGYCWGANRSGQLGTTASLATCNFGTVPPFGCTGTPVPVAGGLKFREIHTGMEHACGLTTSNEIWCWGLNSSGQVGDGTLVNAFTPQRVQ